jgi:hypothetical protein
MVHTARNLRITINADGGILLDVSRGRFFRLNPLASRIIDALQQGKTVTEVVNQISHECLVDTKIVRLDVEEFIQQLHAEGLFQTAQSDKSPISWSTP